MNICVQYDTIVIGYEESTAERISMDFNLLYQRMFEAVSVGGIQNIAETASLVCSQPVVITDAAFRVLGVYPKSNQDDPIWDTMLQKGYVPHDMVMLFYQEKYMEFANSKPEMTLVNWGPLTDKPRVMTPILINGAVEGYAGMMCPNELYDASYDEAIKIIAKAAAIGIERNTELDISSKPLAKVFISNLFNNLVLTASQLSTWQNNLGLSANMNYRLVGIKPYSAAGQGMLKYLTSSITSRFPNQLSLISENILYVLLFLSPKEAESNKLPEKFDSLLESFDARCGISRAFSDLLKFSAYRQQVQILLNIAPKLYSNRKSSEYDDCALEAMLSVSLEHLDYDNYSAPEIEALSAFDRENNTDYLSTLRVYLERLENSGDSAKVLDIHRNTLLYRINKIEELLSIDLKEPDVFTRLLLCFRLLEMNNRLNTSQPAN